MPEALGRKFAPASNPRAVRPKSDLYRDGLSPTSSLNCADRAAETPSTSPCGGGGRDGSGRNENLSAATGTATRLRRRAGRRQWQGVTRAGFEAFFEGQRKDERKEGHPSEGVDPPACPAKRRDAVPVAAERFSLRPITSLPPPPQALSQAQSLPDRIQPLGILKRQIRRPALLAFNQFDLNLREKLALANELDLPAGRHGCFLYPGPRSTFPGSFPVIFPPSITGTPLTRT
jgi:hypothetical protein